MMPWPSWRQSGRKTGRWVTAAAIGPGVAGFANGLVATQRPTREIFKKEDRKDKPMRVTDTASTPPTTNALFCLSKLRQISESPTQFLRQILNEQALTELSQLTPAEQALIADEIDHRRDVRSRRLDLIEEQVNTPRARFIEAVERAAACRLSAALGQAAEAKAAARCYLEEARSIRTATIENDPAMIPPIRAAETMTKTILTVNPVNRSTCGPVALRKRALRALHVMASALY